MANSKMLYCSIVKVMISQSKIIYTKKFTLFFSSNFLIFYWQPKSLNFSKTFYSLSHYLILFILHTTSKRETIPQDLENRDSVIWDVRNNFPPSFGVLEGMKVVMTNYKKMRPKDAFYFFCLRDRKSFKQEQIYTLFGCLSLAVGT